MSEEYTYEWECDECGKKITAQTPNRLLWLAGEHIEQKGCDRNFLFLRISDKEENEVEKED